jgi:hypothetical protein
VVRYSEILPIVNIAFVRQTAGTELSQEMAELLALVIFDDYELFPTKPEHRNRIRESCVCETLSGPITCCSSTVSQTQYGLT